ncbi:hypothetical protein ASPCADRAFT_203631 [Aspergillus carbonarius ITEM 5010]|uniref:Uncharacterized protein n=1 Tax=Aspergillus carbonarius (strain ITEM 5010) TaxID=602072 RepID=A0A1R3RZ85_ASPC5|nr:hypothetical protein ASPCADRAFT_203631 [Aspergillus carbonarius ITEM 5010]
MNKNQTLQQTEMKAEKENQKKQHRRRIIRNHRAFSLPQSAQQGGLRPEVTDNMPPKRV